MARLYRGGVPYTPYSSLGSESLTEVYISAKAAYPDKEVGTRRVPAPGGRYSDKRHNCKNCYKERIRMYGPGYDHNPSEKILVQAVLELAVATHRGGRRKVLGEFCEGCGAPVNYVLPPNFPEEREMFKALTKEA